MSKSLKIILSFTILIIITMIVTSFTYAYYSTRIIGNKNNTSIDITVTTSRIRISELNNKIATIGLFNTQMIEPGYQTVKKYTIQNIGTEKAIYSIYLKDVYNDFERYEDIRYILYRNKGNNSIGSNLDKYEIISEGIYPRTDNLLVKDEVINKPGEYYTYALKVIYKNDPDESQVVDMDHTFSGKFSVSGTNDDLNPFEENTLAYKIIDNSLNYRNNTVLRSKALTNLGGEIPLENELELVKLKDNYGDAYYYRGNVIDNYLELNKTCFRIVGILGDGSIKLILANDGLCVNSNTNTGIIGNTSYSINNDVNFISNYDVDLKRYLERWIENKTFNNIITAEWCNDTYVVGIGSFGSFSRISKSSPSLKCTNRIIESNVGVLTSDEVAISGSILEENNKLSKTYLNQNAISKWWTMSPKEYNNIFIYDGNTGLLSSTNANNELINIRPVIVINKNVSYIKGDGTINNPYEVE